MAALTEPSSPLPAAKAMKRGHSTKEIWVSGECFPHARISPLSGHLEALRSPLSSSCYGRCSPQQLRIGHGVVIALMASVLAVRLFGFAEDGTTLAMDTQKVKAGGEVLFLALNVIGYALQTSASKRREM